MAHSSLKRTYTSAYGYNVPESFRAIEHIPPEEIQGAMILIIRHAVGISIESLIIETARLFGFGRTGDTIRHRLVEEYEALKRKSKILENGDSVTLRGAGF